MQLHFQYRLVRKTPCFRALYRLSLQIRFACSPNNKSMGCRKELHTPVTGASEDQALLRADTAGLPDATQAEVYGLRAAMRLLPLPTKDEVAIKLRPHSCRFCLWLALLYNGVRSRIRRWHGFRCQLLCLPAVCPCQGFTECT